jgi:hypothetical protein
MHIERLTQIDALLDYVPGVSTLTSLVTIFQKVVVLPRLSPEEISNSHYYSYVASKEVLRCVLLLIPCIGNIVIALWDICIHIRRGHTSVPEESPSIDRSLGSHSASELTQAHEDPPTLIQVEELPIDQGNSSHSIRQQSSEDVDVESTISIDCEEDLEEISDESEILHQFDHMDVDLATYGIQLTNALKDRGISLPPMAVNGDDISIILRLVQACAYALRSDNEEGHTRLATPALSQIYLSIGTHSATLAAMRIDGGLYSRIPLEFRGDREIALAACGQNGLALLNMPPELLEDRHLLKVALSNIAMNFLCRESGGLCAKEAALRLVRRNGLDLQHLEEHFKCDREIVLAAIQQNHAAISFADQELQYDFSKHVYRAMAILQLSEDGMFLHWVLEELLDDRDVVLIAVRENGHALHFVPEPLRNDPSIITAAKSSLYQ